MEIKLKIESQYRYFGLLKKAIMIIRMVRIHFVHQHTQQGVHLAMALQILLLKKSKI